ncbi:MAG: tRNA uridine(34) 5-carboxymethylaminomethyl modification radical SAM/GNAT enzyme Elp3 [Candidatus Altiarchaeales archaeon IMC4]|nr:MAG: tRNA uridine(34) 5-carboxymethylaminomethyl modification radical SAM/GNAT enzyme Elp3 [Candidatus Altiarchaeales archaeon IMC4]
MDPYREIIGKILSGAIKTRNEIDCEKRAMCVKLGLNQFIRNSEILEHARQEERASILNLLQKKPTRTVSGVAVVAAMTRPSKCPHGKCKYCPGGPDIEVPQSYTGKEPATRRAIRYEFNPYLQVTLRLAQLKKIGHPVDKAELIVMGGTLTAQCLDYQEWFVKECIRAMNEFSENYGVIEDVGEDEFIKKYKKLPVKFRYLEDVQQENENADVRCVGMTFEPRPDWARIEEINNMLGFGVTRIEMGVQNPDDEIYKKVERGHTVQDVISATQELKDSGLKVSYHMMPGIMGNNPELDIGAFKRIFEDPDFRPDMLKIYPLIVLKGTEYYDWWRAGKFEPITTDEAVDTIIEVKRIMPKWVRTMRIMRDIPSNLVEAGIKHSNLGELVYSEMEKRGVKCGCIRCREVGRFLQNGIEPNPRDIGLARTDYEASGGKEIFLSFEDTKQDMLIGFLRLRIPNKPFRPEIVNAALVRELHVYGPMVEIGEKPRYEWQHRGYGKELLEEAERIAREEFGAKKILVTSGIGARNYYRKFAYERDGVYMGKKL